MHREIANRKGRASALPTIAAPKALPLCRRLASLLLPLLLPLLLLLRLLLSAAAYIHLPQAPNSDEPLCITKSQCNAQQNLNRSAQRNLNAMHREIANRKGRASALP